MVNDQEVTDDNAAFSLLNGYNRQKRLGGLGISMHIDEIDSLLFDVYFYIDCLLDKFRSEQRERVRSERKAKSRNGRR